MNWYDFNLIDKIRDKITLPLTVLGGAGSLDDIKEVIKKYNIIGVAAGSLFVFKGPYKAVLINYPNRKIKNQIYYENQK
jgi:cyclase